MTEILKLCRHCRFYKKGWVMPADLVKCRHPQAIEGTPAQLVDGRAPQHRYCTTMRYDHHPCGTAGNLWEPR